MDENNCILTPHGEIDAIKLARQVLARENAQPIPLSTEETRLLACAVLYLHKSAQVVNDDPHDTVESGANARQVGGKHYGLGARQHWDLVVEYGWDYFQGQVTKYLMRWRKKNGVEDLEKAAHFLQKYIEEVKAGRFRGTAG